MKKFTINEKEYFKDNIDTFTLEEKGKLIDSNLVDIIKYDLRDICKNWKDEENRIKAFKLWENLFNNDDLIDICEYWKDEEIKIEAKKLLDSKLNKDKTITKDNFIIN